MIPRRMRRRKPPQVRTPRHLVIKSTKPLTFDQMRRVEEQWAEASKRPTRIFWDAPDMTIEEIRT